MDFVSDLSKEEASYKPSDQFSILCARRRNDEVEIGALVVRDKEELAFILQNYADIIFLATFEHFCHRAEFAVLDFLYNFIFDCVTAESGQKITRLKYYPAIAVLEIDEAEAFAVRAYFSCLGFRLRPGGMSFVVHGIIIPIFGRCCNFFILLLVFNPC